MVCVVIGIDPHKKSHTAVALDAAERVVGQVRVVAGVDQLEVLRRWARGWPRRIWAIEGARGLGRLLSDQLVGAGERVVDVPPKLAARVRLLNTGQLNKNDPNDARSVAVAALRARGLNEITPDNDDAAVLRLWARRYRDLGRLRTQLLCRLHAVLSELIAGGFAKSELSVGQATDALDAFVAGSGAGRVADSVVVQAKVQLAGDLIADLRRLDEQRRDAKRRTARAIADTHTSITEIYGVGPIVAGTVLGYVRDIRRFPTRDHFAAYNGTAPIEVSSGNRVTYRLSRRGNRQLNYVIHMAAVTQIRHHDTEGRAYYDRKISEGMAGKAALRALKRKISDLIYAGLIRDARRGEQAKREKGPGGQSGNNTVASVAGSHPDRPALRISHSRAVTNPRTGASRNQAPETTRVLTPLPAPAKRRPSRSATGVKVQPRAGRQRRTGQERA
jgi:transposase